MFFRWNGVVGHTLYGDVDVGLCNIDFTHIRYSVVDYAAFISPNEIRTLSRKPRPTSRLFQVFKPFTPTVWYFLLATSSALFLALYFIMNVNERYLGSKPKPFLWLLIKVYLLSLVYKDTKFYSNISVL